MTDAKRQQWLKLIPELVVNFVLPWVAYKLALPKWGEVDALLASALPPLLWSVVELIRFRRIDALSLIVIAGIVLSLAGLAMGGDTRVLLMRESLVSGLLGLAFLVSLLFPRPLIYHLARATVARQSAEALAAFEANLDQPPVRRGLFTMTLIWGGGLTFEMIIRAALAWSWPTERFLLVSPFISYGLMGLLVLLTLWQRRRIQAEMAPPLQAQSAAAAPQG
ncbi:VC0807 family protein [Paucibacter sp. APW11]|uniref:VC0807 family protein n=1 Tax=Roseateles aquae TaxID=3077235 RepID=A0ABU3PHQ6_9BURK|nr:VC0807 family protein [Paucibacter sp. APW11]MDT9002058.1 VC0807 family protein [Paucibacter sp. APW11]